MMVSSMGVWLVGHIFLIEFTRLAACPASIRPRG
jgi:hypothetical protein